ncbi:lipopolysaccharide biosynthesis protein [Lysinibacillus antri]|uniref:Lipopolysaccharide biosynthesis protein n=1 Tax=Lysinibacillus antri TaxID=2498145 RepID=A0A432LFM6_9BACI|nr:lipopolysaccharide biosynthesis protein [Lysinibacillus antri]RUL55171.1 lipopolysaccharide biosynthesis protein [Lysinibacillus antri]
MGSEITKIKVITSLIWKLLERIGVQGIQFLVTILLARLILPEEFGLFVLVSIFIILANVFIQSGFNIALIQKKNADELDFSSVFFLNIFVASICYIIFYLTSPYIATFFEQPQATTILRILSITLFFGAINSIQNAIIARNMQFKKLFISSISAVVISGIVGLAMAYAKLGIWALVAQQLTQQLVVTVNLLITVNWRPKFLFSFNRIKSLFSFGWKLLVSALIDTLNNNIRNLIIGKMFSPASLAFYNRGEQFPSIIISNINSSIQSVLFPVLATEQDDRKRVKEIVRRSIVTSSFIIFPMMIGLGIVAEPVVQILLTDTWLPAVPFLQIFCAVYALWPIQTTNLQAINAIGRSDIFLRIEVIKKIIGLLVLVISIPFGIYGIALGIVCNGIIATFINSYPNIKLLNYSLFEQLRDVLPSFFISVIMGIVVFSIQFLNLMPLILLLIQILVGIVVYICLAILFKLECFSYLLSVVKELSKRKKHVTV